VITKFGQVFPAFGQLKLWATSPNGSEWTSCQKS